MAPIRKKQKTECYFQQLKQIKKKDKEMGIPRVQDVSKAIQIRTRQNNFGMPNYELPSSHAASWSPSTEMMVSKKTWDCYVPDQNGNQQVRWIRNSNDLMELKKRLVICSEFALDTEANLYDSRLGFICLIQISTWKYGDFLIGAIELHDEIMKNLKDVLEDPKILKIMHGCANDILWFQKDFGIYINGVADTQEFVLMWKGVKSISYSNLCHKFYPQYDSYSNLSTITNWALRPEMGMTKDQVAYAVNDTHLLLRIFDQIRFQMRKDKQGMIESFEKSNDKTTRVFRFPEKQFKEPVDVFNDCVHFLQKKNVKSKDGYPAHRMTLQQKRTLRALVEWRNLFARIVDQTDNSLISPVKLFRLVEVENPTRHDVHKIVGDVGLIAEYQKQIILKILTREDKPKYIRHLKSLECHNCLSCGHGPAVFCPLPRNPNAIYIWLLREENEYYLRERFNYKNNIRKERQQAELTYSEYVQEIRYLARRSD